MPDTNRSCTIQRDELPLVWELVSARVREGQDVRAAFQAVVLDYAWIKAGLATGELGLHKPAGGKETPCAEIKGSIHLTSGGGWLVRWGEPEA